MQLAPDVQASLAQVTMAEPASTETVPVQSLTFVHATVHVALVHAMGPAQLPGPAPVHWMLHEVEARQVTPPSEQDSSPLHCTVQSLPAHFTSSQVLLPLQTTAQELACVQSMSPWHVSSFAHSTLHGTFGGHVTPDLHGFAAPHVNTHVPASEHAPPVAVHEVPQPGVGEASPSRPPSRSGAASFLGSELSIGASALSAPPNTRVATASIPQATTRPAIATEHSETAISRVRSRARDTRCTVPSSGPRG